MKIVIWTGASYEPWGPRSLDDGGIGGSETAAIHMAFELAKLGHEVVMVGEHEGYEGKQVDVRLWGKSLSNPKAAHLLPVEYVHYKRAIANPSLLTSDVLVSSRDKRILRLKPDTKVTILWVHDIHVGDDWENEVSAFDRVYALTKWHKGFLLDTYPNVDPDKFSVTRNGIDPSRFEPDRPWPELLAQKGPRFVWSSSLDRGLDVMLDLWPQVKKLRSDATLEIYYGIDNWRKINAKNPKGLAVIDYFMARIASMKGAGVHYHGRVGQAELARAHMGALVWAYPTAWLESSCITAMEAQAAGAFPVTSALAALTETVHSGFLVPGRNKSQGYQDLFLDYIREALVGDQPAFEHRGLVDLDFGRQGNREFVLEERTWAGVAKSWVADFEKLIAEKRS